MTCGDCNCDTTSTTNPIECTCELARVPVSSLDGVQVMGKATEFKCPVCVDQPLHVGDINKTQVCFCSHCRGFVIDRMSFGELVEILRAAYEGPDDSPLMIEAEDLKKLCSCPACGDLMETFSYYGPGNVVLDTCNLCCLTWLNEGELGMIVRAPGQRNYHGSSNFESEVLRKQLYDNAESDFAVGVFLLGRLFT